MESNENLSDAYLVHLVRLQNYVEKIHLVSVPADGIDDPLAMYVQMLHAQMRQFRGNLPGEVGNNSKHVPNPHLHYQSHCRLYLYAC